MSPALPSLYQQYSKSMPNDHATGSGSREPSPPHYTSVVQRDDASTYTLATITRPGTPDSFGSDRSPLLRRDGSGSNSRFFSYGTIPRILGLEGASRKKLLNAAMKMAALFVLSSLLLGGTLWLALPTLDE